MQFEEIIKREANTLHSKEHQINKSYLLYPNIWFIWTFWVKRICTACNLFLVPNVLTLFWECVKMIGNNCFITVLDVSLCPSLLSMIRLPALAPPAAGHIVSTDQLTTYLTSAFGSGPRTVLLFLQDKVSVFFSQDVRKHLIEVQWQQDTGCVE